MDCFRYLSELPAAYLLVYFLQCFSPACVIPTNVVKHLLLSTILSLIFYIGAAEGMIEYPGPVVIQETKMLGNTGVDVCREGT